LSGSEPIEVLVPTLVGSDGAVAEMGLIASTMKFSCGDQLAKQPAVRGMKNGAVFGPIRETYRARAEKHKGTLT
jgi:hypothetical protein